MNEIFRNACGLFAPAPKRDVLYGMRLKFVKGLLLNFRSRTKNEYRTRKFNVVHYYSRDKSVFYIKIALKDDFIGSEYQWIYICLLNCVGFFRYINVPLAFLFDSLSQYETSVMRSEQYKHFQNTSSDLSKSVTFSCLITYFRRLYFSCWSNW